MQGHHTGSSCGILNAKGNRGEEKIFERIREQNHQDLVSDRQDEGVDSQVLDLYNSQHYHHSQLYSLYIYLVV